MSSFKDATATVFDLHAGEIEIAKCLPGCLQFSLRLGHCFLAVQRNKPRKPIQIPSFANRKAAMKFTAKSA